MIYFILGTFVILVLIVIGIMCLGAGGEDSWESRGKFDKEEIK